MGDICCLNNDFTLLSHLLLLLDPTVAYCCMLYHMHIPDNYGGINTALCSTQNENLCGKLALSKVNIPTQSTNKTIYKRDFKKNLLVVLWFLHSLFNFTFAFSQYLFQPNSLLLQYTKHQHKCAKKRIKRFVILSCPKLHSVNMVSPSPHHLTHIPHPQPTCPVPPSPHKMCYHKL